VKAPGWALAKKGIGGAYQHVDGTRAEA
jgi:hypothetical protein